MMNHVKNNNECLSKRCIERTCDKQINDLINSEK